MTGISISIVIPVHNGSPYLRGALESIFAQTYGQFDVHILENCSTDNTLEIIKSFDDDRIRVYPAARFLSIEENWQRILTLNTHEYFLTLCHDDVLYPEYLETIVNVIREQPEASLYHTHFHLINERGRVIQPSYSMPAGQSGDDFLSRQLLRKEHICGSGYTMRLSDFKQIGGFPAYPKLLYADTMCWYRASALGKKATSPEILYAFRTSGETTTGSSHWQMFAAAVLQLEKDVKQTSFVEQPVYARQLQDFVHHSFDYAHRKMLINLLLSAEDNRFSVYAQQVDELREMIQPHELSRTSLARFYGMAAYMPGRLLRRGLVMLAQGALRWRHVLLAWGKK